MTAPTFAPRTQPQVQPKRRAPAPHPRPHLWVVGAGEPRQRRITRMVTGALVVAVFATLFATVALRVLLAQGQVDIDRLTESIEAQQAVQQDLRLAVAELESPAQIVGAARQRLGMVTPAVVIYLDPAPPVAAAR